MNVFIRPFVFINGLRPFVHYEGKMLIMRLIMNLIMRVFGHYEPLEIPNLIMNVSLIRLIMRLLVFQCVPDSRGHAERLTQVEDDLVSRGHNK